MERKGIPSAKPVFHAPFATLVFLICSSPLFATEIPERPEGYVSDYADMISPTARTSLEAKLRQFEEETSNQVIVATFQSLEGKVLEEFSMRLAETWKIGQKGKDNGVILIIFKEDHKVRIEVGYGLEGTLPDTTAKLIIENEIVPRFRGGQFDEGVDSAVKAIIAATKGEYRAEPTDLPLNIGYLIGALFLGILAGIVLPLMILRVICVGCLLFAVFALLFGEYVVALSALLMQIVVLITSFISSRWKGKPLVLAERGTGIRRRTRDLSSWSFGGGGSFDTGFSGGGGSFGGGGASGSW